MLGPPNQININWRQLVTTDLRNRMAHRIVQAVFPSCDFFLSIVDPRVLDLVAFARAVEEGLYFTASSHSEYLQLIAQKVQTVNREIEERRRCQNKFFKSQL